MFPRIQPWWIGFSEDDDGAGAHSGRHRTARIATATQRPEGGPSRLPQRAPRAFTYRRARMTRFAIHKIATIATTHGARNAIATPIMRRLHMIAPAL